MFRLIFVTVAAFGVLATAQQYHQNPQTAAIISEQRYQSGDGKFGSAYTQEDGTDFKEETDADGTRHGSYSYIDPSGQKKTVSYTAGKNGFQASGDHLPVAPPAPPQAAPQPQYQPQYRSNGPSAPAYQPQQQFHNGGGSQDYDDGSYDPRLNDPAFSLGSQPRYSAPQPQQYQQPAPAVRQQQQYQPQPQQQPQYNQAPQYNPAPQPQYTTQNPNRFSPPGKLSLNRTPDGFSYSFNKV